MKEEEEDERITEIVGREPCKDAIGEAWREDDERQRLFDYMEIC